jgi:hypothetical protein
MPREPPVTNLEIFERVLKAEGKGVTVFGHGLGSD